MNLEQLTNISIDTDKTKDIANLCNELLSQNKTVEQAEIALKNAKAEQLRLSEEVIPAVMSEAGISMLKLEDGSSVEVAPYYYAKIPEDKKADAFKWLRDNNFGDLVKNNLTLSTANSCPRMSPKHLARYFSHHGILSIFIILIPLNINSI